MTPEQIKGLRNYARQQSGIKHVSMAAESVMELCDAAEAVERMMSVWIVSDFIDQEGGSVIAVRRTKDDAIKAAEEYVKLNGPDYQRESELVWRRRCGGIEIKEWPLTAPASGARSE